MKIDIRNEDCIFVEMGGYSFNIDTSLEEPVVMRCPNGPFVEDEDIVYAKWENENV